MATAHRTPGNIYPCLSYDDAPAAIEWLCRVFGFTERLVVPGPEGRVMHSELTHGPGVVMVSSTRPEEGRVSPRGLPAVNQTLSVRIADPDAHYAHAKAAGAEIMRGLEDEDYGARGYIVKDLEGHVWYFADYDPGAYWSDGADPSPAN